MSSHPKALAARRKIVADGRKQIAILVAATVSNSPKTLEQLGDALGVSAFTASRIVRGLRKLEFTELVLVARLCDVEPEKFLKRCLSFLT